MAFVAIDGDDIGRKLAALHVSVHDANAWSKLRFSELV